MITKTHPGLLLALAVAASMPSPDKARANDIVATVRINQGVFYQKSTKHLFSPRGSDYVTLVQASHQTLQPGTYSSTKTDKAFATMQSSGYNFVRITLDCTDLQSSPGVRGRGFSKGFMHNLTSLLKVASQHGLYVSLTVSQIPRNYAALVTPSISVGPLNADILNPTYATARAAFWIDLLAAVRSSSALAYKALFAIDVCNEVTVSAGNGPASLPFSKTSGTFVFNRVSYDLSQAKQRQSLIDTATLSWIKVLSSSIKRFDPSMLVGLSLYTPLAAGHSGFDGAAISSSNPRYPLKPTIIMQSKADYLDVHTYPLGPNYNVGKDLQSAGLTTDQVFAKPLYIGEFGAIKILYPTTQMAQQALVSQIAGTCTYGFSGWALYTWDAVDSGLWNATESGSAINNAVSPGGLSRPCRLIPDGNFIASINGTEEMFASNGTSFCWHKSLSKNLKQNQSNSNIHYMSRYHRIPATMVYDGVCGD